MALFSDEERDAIKAMGGGPDVKRWEVPKEDPPRRISNEQREAMWKELVRLCVRGVSIRKAADALGVHVSTVWKWRQDAQFKLMLARTRAAIIEKAQLAEDLGEEPAKAASLSVEEIVERASVRALQLLIEKLESPNEHIQLKAAIDLADRNPKISKTKRIQGGIVHTVMTPQQLALIARAAREATEDFEAGKVMEAVPIKELKGDVLPEELD